MAIGFAYDAGSGAKALTAVFAGTYVVGCILAVLAVRQAGIFTAVIQPPLLLFGAVPMAYFVFTDSQLTNFKDTLINCAYPLIERFPLMFFTSAIVLLIGMARWYLGMSARRGTPSATAEDEPSGGGLGSAVMSKVSALLAGRDAGEQDDEVDEPPRRRSAAARSSRSTSRSGKPSSRSTPSRSRHARPPETEIIEPVQDRPRRPRPSRQAEPPNEPRRKPARGRASAERCRPPIAAPDTSGPSVGAATTTSSRHCHTAAAATAHITRSHGCATGVAKTATTRAHRDGARAIGRSKAGNTTSDPPRCGPA